MSAMRRKITNGGARPRSAAADCALMATGMTAVGAILLVLGVLSGGGLEVGYVGGAILAVGSLILYGTALWMHLTGFSTQPEK
jgi:hypothetical protein